MDQEGARGGDAVEQPLDPKLVHQKADGAAVHAKDRQTPPLVEQLVQHVEQETVAAERDQQVGLGQVDEVVKRAQFRSEEHTSELQSLMRISYAVFCLKKTKKITKRIPK